MKIGPGVSELWRVENRPLPLTRPMAYTTACTTVQAVIWVKFCSCSIHARIWLGFPSRENTLTISLLCSALNCPRWKCSVLFWVISRMTTRLIAHPTTTLKTPSSTCIWGSFRRPWLITFKSATLTSCVNRIKCARPELFSLSILIQEMGGWRHRTSLLKAFPL